MGLLFSTDRLSQTPPKGADNRDKRWPAERDYDRILFSAPVRRLADKTQVFPLEKNDSVRRRLTHSHEVSNLCRSLATQIVRVDPAAFGPAKEDADLAPIVAAAVGLAHDLGNPPFGHQGEGAIRGWFESRKDTLWGASSGVTFTPAQKSDFLNWEANAQTFRLVTRLQLTNGKHGLDLTAGTLSALMKYTAPSDKTAKGGHPALKKPGFFGADADTAAKVFDRVGLAEGQRHPIAYVMEACDDIAYSIIDIEDAIKKRLVSIHDVIAELDVDRNLKQDVQTRVDELRGKNRTPHDLNDLAAQYYRTFAIGTMMVAARTAYIENKAAILAGTFDKPLMDASAAHELCERLKTFARTHAYRSTAVKEAELIGGSHIQRLMTYYWRAIDECSLDVKTEADMRERLGCKPRSPFGDLVFERISSNYRECFRASINDTTEATTVRYHQLLLLTDMVSGMTDQYATNTSETLRELDDDTGRAHP